MFNKVHIYILLGIGAVLLVFLVYLGMPGDERLLEDNTCAENSYSKEEFYTKWLDIIIEQRENEEKDMTQNSVLNNSIPNIPVISGKGKILNMPVYINQGNYKNVPRGDGKKDVSEYGCIDCSSSMIAAYYHRNDSNFNINDYKNMAYISVKYVDGQSFNLPSFCTEQGLEYSRVGPSTQLGGVFKNFESEVRAHIDSGRPLFTDIHGHWEVGGVVYHKSNNDHHLVIVGYDAEKVYVYDPGSSSNTSKGIPWVAWNYVPQKYYREVGPLK